MKKRVLYHFAFWIIYYLWSSYVTASFDYRFYRAFMSEAFTLPLKIAVTYIILYYLLPKYFYTKKYRQLIFLFLLLVISTGIIFRIIQGEIILPTYYPQRPFTPFDAARFMWAIFEVFAVAAIAVCIKMFTLKFESLQREVELKKEKLQAELSFLKAQINPHFLFNTLNNIYGLSLKGSTQTSDSILKLSSLLRFMLVDGAETKIKLCDEITNLENYIEIEKLRYNNRLNIIFEKNIDNENEMIAPLLLLPFVENSFKHGASESRSFFTINISISLKNRILSFSVINEKENEESNSNNIGIGLKNIKRQLELIYQKNHSIEIINSKNNFEVYLTIDLGEHDKALLLNN